MNHKRNYGYGGHGKDRYSGSGGPSRADTSSLFGEVPDVMGIKTAFDSRRLDRNSIQPHFDKVVNDAKNFIRWGPDRRLASAVTVAAYLRAQGLKTNQVRKILEMARTTELKVKRGDLDIKNDIVKMRYLLAYTVGKATGQPKYPLEAFHSVLDPMLEVLMENPTEEGFEKFYDFLQAVVAYHRFFGGRE